MAVKAPAGRPAPGSSKQLRQLGRALGESDESVQLVTYDPEQDILAVFVDAAEDKSQHERAAIRVWIDWLDKLAGQLDFRLFNLSEIPSERSKRDLLAAYQGNVLFDRR